MLLKNGILGLVLGSLLLSLAGSCWASIEASPQNTFSAQENNGARVYSLAYTTVLSTNSYFLGRSEHQSSQTHSLRGVIYLPKAFTLSTSLGVNQDFGNEKKLLFRDGALTLASPIVGLSRNIKTTGRATVILPLSEYSSKTAGLMTAISLTPVVSINADKIAPDLTFFYSPTFIYRLYRYETSLDGSSNNEYGLSQNLGIAYSILDNLRLSLNQSYTRSWTHSGSTNDFFSLGQSLSAVFFKSLSLFVGHSIGQSALAANGEEFNTKIFDIKKSNYYAGMSYQF